jgi:hypothetical protein
MLIPEGKIIKGIYWDDECGSQFQVGSQGITRIVFVNTYHGDKDENWFHIFKGDTLIHMANAKFIASVAFVENGDG